MKLEYLESGSQDCPLIRLYEFEPSEASLLRDAFGRLADGAVDDIDLAAEPYVMSIAKCRLRLCRGKRNTGIKRSKDGFECVLSSEGWLEARDKTTPFCKAGHVGYQWLNEDSDVSLLLSPTGTW